jgi:ribosome biogenesis GTPase
MPAASEVFIVDACCVIDRFQPAQVKLCQNFQQETDMINAPPTLAELGWSHFFQAQMSLEEWETTTPVRVFGLNRHLVETVGVDGRRQVSLPVGWHSHKVEEMPTVGDWLLLDSNGDVIRLLDRTSLFKRMASGRESKIQLMGANIDTLFVVTSCNQDFNLSRIERYLALGLDAGVEPVVVLTKIDLSDEVEMLRSAAESLRKGMAVVAVNSKQEMAIEILKPWCGIGQTVALVGSSGVGKSTLVNTLLRDAVQEIGAIRELDAKGRHTTTARSLHLLPVGGLLLDSPGMRELQLGDCEEGVSALFEEIETVARGCRFSDCRHQGEAGCAVAAADERGELDPRRLANYLKLRFEQERTSETLEQKRRKDKNFGKMVKRALKHKNKNCGEY